MEKLLRQNIDRNLPSDTNLRKPTSTRKKHVNVSTSGNTRNLEFLALDWETDSVLSLPVLLGDSKGIKDANIDVVIACDCIYNESLIAPFVSTCADLCRIALAKPSARPTMCIVAQQLRSPDVFEAWLAAFKKSFRVWRVPDSLLTNGLKQGSGFVVHIGVIIETSSDVST